MFALPHIEHGVCQVERIVQAVLDLDVEPRVDALVDELHREVEDDQERECSEPDEHGDDARLELCPGHVRPVFAHEPAKVAGHEQEQDQDTGDVDNEKDVVQLVEVVRVPCRLRQQEQRRQREPDARDGEERYDDPFQRSSDHSYHSLLSCHCERQKNSKRKGAGYCCVWSSARSRTR